jgi:hypothetical protein
MGSTAPLAFAMLFSPELFCAGVVVGIIARAVVIGRPAASA